MINPGDSTSPIPVLAIEDDIAIRRLLRVAFESTPYTLIDAETAQEGVDIIVKRRPELILLDLALPDVDGLEVIKTVRGWSSTPIIVISGTGKEDQKVAALENGADDYVTKPFGVAELLARMGVALRHAAGTLGQAGDAIFDAGDLRIDRSAREVTIRGERVKLTPIEYKLLLALSKHAGKVVTHRQLLIEVWGPEYSEEGQYLRVYMGYLRKKLEIQPDKPSILLNEPRVGYRLAV
jgi:two-component system KDP operon response regulator KdpE